MIYARHLKRPFDIAASTAVLTVASPLILSLAYLNLLLLHENPFIKVDRVGKDGRVFNMLKIKSMRTTFDAAGNLLPDEERRTRFGKFLRKTGMDELPQFINVLKGDMSIVGPRPGDDRIANGYMPTVRPGIAGPWQVAVIGARKRSTLEERNKLDASYAEEGITFSKDMKYLLKTLISPFYGHDGETWSNKP